MYCPGTSTARACRSSSASPRWSCSGLVGVLVGLVSGYLGGLVDSVFMQIVDAWLAFPFLLMAIAIVAILGPGLQNIVIALVITGWVVSARLVRGETLSLREREFVLSSRASAPPGRRSWSSTSCRTS